MASPKSMTLTELKSYRQELMDQGKTLSTSKELGKVEDLIKTKQPEKYGKETVASAYTKLSSGVTEFGGWTERNAENIRKYTGKYPDLIAKSGGGDGSSQLSEYLNSYQEGVYSFAGQPDVREQISAQIEPDIAQPEPINRVETFEQMREEYGLPALETQLNDLKSQLRDEYAVRRQRTQAAEGEPVALGVIGGRVSEIERQEAERIDTINREIAFLTDQISTAYGVMDTYINLMGMDYQDAYQRYQDEYDKNLQIYKLVDEELDERKASARANLQTFANAIMSGNLSYGQLSQDQKLSINKLELQSGLPVGFVSSLRMSPSDQLLSVNDKTGEALLMDANGNFIVKQTGMTPSPSGTKEDDDYKQEQAFNSAVDDGISQLKEGESWGTVWTRIKTEFPEVPDIVIDDALGVSWREGGAYEEYQARQLAGKMGLH